MRAHWFRGRLAPVLILAAMCAGLLALGIRTTHDLTVPPEGDSFRDLAIARTIADGRFGSDPAFAGETLWYNPLFPAIIAGVSKLTGVPLPVVSVRFATYLNLLGPIAFFLLLSLLFDGWIAVAGTAVLLFIIPMSYPQLERGPYTPWPVPWCFAQGLFCLTLYLFIRAIRSGRGLLYLASGVMLGITFLAHTAPATILGAIFTVMMLLRIGRPRDRHKTADIHRWMLACGALVGPAFIIALPFLAPIWSHYHFKIVDPVPLTYVDPSLLVENVRLRIQQEVSSPTTYIALVGLLGIIAGKTVGKETREALLLWIAATFLLLLYGYAYQMMVERGHHPPAAVSAWHFFYYGLVARAILVGFGLILAGRSLIDLAAHRIRGVPLRLERSGRDGRLIAGRGIAFAVLAVWIGLLLPGYVKRPEFIEERNAAVDLERETDALRALDWISAHTDRDAVVLASPDLSMWVCALTGRKVVALRRLWSNPYVRGEDREKARAAMMNALLAGDGDRLRDLADRYDVRFVLTDPKTTGDLDSRKADSRKAGIPFLEEVLRSGGFSVLALLPGGRGGPSPATAPRP